MSAMPPTAPLAKLLTIGVPTHNRGIILDRFLQQIGEDLAPVFHRVVVVISDNCSPDATTAVCEKWIAHYDGQLEIRYLRQPTNVGVSRNLVSLFYAAETPYFMFLGDDDRLEPSFVRQLIAILEAPERPSAVIQARWGGRRRSKSLGFASHEAALDLFYEYGNAWASVIDRQLAITAIETRELRQAVEQIVWPQTVIGFLSMYDAKDRPVFLVDAEIGGQLVPDLNIHSKAYWLRSLNDLLRASVLIDEAIGCWRFRRTFVNHRCSGFLGHISSICLNAMLEESPPASDQVVATLRTKFGFRGWCYSLLFVVLDRPGLLRVFYPVIYSLVKKISPRSAWDHIRAMKAAREEKIRDRVRTNRRYGDWF